MNPFQIQNFEHTSSKNGQIPLPNRGGYLAHMDETEMVNCLAARHIKAPEEVAIYHRATPSEMIFHDGSALRYDLTELRWEVIPPDREVIFAEEMAAELWGKLDRLAHLPFSNAYRRASREHLPSVKAAYARGWWSVPDWPKSDQK